jgi:hypothetical protein
MWIAATKTQLLGSVAYGDADAACALAHRYESAW